LPSGPAYEAPEGYLWKDNTLFVGETEVLTRYDGGTREIFAYHNESNRFVQITNDDVNNTCPSISGNYIAWKAGEGQASEICLIYYADADVGGDTGAEYPEPEAVTAVDDLTGGDRGSSSCFVNSVANSTVP
jgi:hypothetical protein